MRNKLINLNDHLFEQLERLNDEDLTPEQLEQEIKRSKAMADIGKVIVDNVRAVVEGIKVVNEYGLTNEEVPEVLRIESHPDSRCKKINHLN